jgi:hypothetical protein
MDESWMGRNLKLAETLEVSKLDAGSLVGFNNAR